MRIGWFNRYNSGIQAIKKRNTMNFPFIGNVLKRIRCRATVSPAKEITPEQRITGCLLASIAVTFRCMCKCPHCGSASFQPSAQDEMSTQEIKDLIKDLRLSGTNSINFFGGEPLIRKDLLELIQYTRSLGMGTAIDTNGYLLDRDMAFALSKAGMDMVHVSIDSADPDKHDQMRGLRGTFERAVAAIKYCKEAGITTRIGAYVDKERLHNGEFERLVELGKELGAPLRTLTAIFTGRLQNADDKRLTPEEIRKFKSLLAPGVAYWEQMSCNGPEEKFICACLAKDYIYVTAYGDVTPCVYVSLSFGNIRKEPLSKILKRMWSHDLFKTDQCERCITNTETFRQKYIGLDPGPGKYPRWLC